MIQYIHLNTKGGRGAEEGEEWERERVKREGKKCHGEDWEILPFMNPPYWFTKQRQITEGGAVEHAMVSNKDIGISNTLRIEKILW